MNYAVLYAQNPQTYIQKEVLTPITDASTHKKGLLNAKGKLVVPCLYDGFIVDGRDEYIIARKGNLYGVITSDNQIVLPFSYNFIYRMKSSKYPCYVTKEAKSANEEKLINLKGEILAQGLHFNNRDSIGNDNKIYFATVANTVQVYELTGELLGSININKTDNPILFSLHFLDKQNHTTQPIVNVGGQQAFHQYNIIAQDTTATIQLVLQSAKPYNCTPLKTVFWVRRHRGKEELKDTFTFNKSETDRTVVVLDITIKQILVKNEATQEEMTIKENWSYHFFLNFNKN